MSTSNIDERLLEAHLGPIKEDIKEIKAMLTTAQERGRERDADIAAMKVEIAFLKRVVFGVASIAGGALVAVILKYLGL